MGFIKKLNQLHRNFNSIENMDKKTEQLTHYAFTTIRLFYVIDTSKYYDIIILVVFRVNKLYISPVEFLPDVSSTFAVDIIKGGETLVEVCFCISLTPFKDKCYSLIRSFQFNK